MVRPLALLKETPGVTYGGFPSLKVIGPYPVKGDMLYLPRPLDWDMLIEPCANTDLPAPLTYGFIDHVDGKKKYPAWITCEDYAKYLRREERGLYDAEETGINDKGEKITRKFVKFPYADGSLFGVESRIGTTLDPCTGASKRVKGQHASGQYQGEYLRLQKDVSMWCAVETGTIGMATGANDVPETPRLFVMGGQGGIVTRHATDVDLAAKLPAPSSAFPAARSESSSVPSHPRVKETPRSHASFRFPRCPSRSSRCLRCTASFPQAPSPAPRVRTGPP